MVCHAAFYIVRQISGCCNYSVLWCNSRIGDLLLFVENCGQDSCCPRFFHLHYQQPIMLKIYAKYVSFATMLRKFAPPLRIFVHQRLHSDWYKQCRVVIVRPHIHRHRLRPWRVKFSSRLQRLKQSYLLTYY